MFDISKIIDGLQGALTVAKNLAPAAEALGLPPVVSVAAQLVSAAIDVAENTIDRINEGKIVAGGGDAATVRAILEDLRAENDALAAKIAAS